MSVREMKAELAKKAAKKVRYRVMVWVCAHAAVNITNCFQNGKEPESAKKNEKRRLQESDEDEEAGAHEGKCVIESVHTCTTRGITVVIDFFCRLVHHEAHAAAGERGDGEGDHAEEAQQAGTVGVVFGVYITIWTYRKLTSLIDSRPVSLRPPTRRRRRTRSRSWPLAKVR